MGDFPVMDEDCDRRMLRVWQAIEGDGQPGLRQIIDGIKEEVVKLTATEKERQRNHQESQNRLNLIIALLLVLMTGLGVLVSIEGLRKTSQMITHPLSDLHLVDASLTHSEDASSPLY